MLLNFYVNLCKLKANELIMMQFCNAVLFKTLTCNKIKIAYDFRYEFVWGFFTTKYKFKTQIFISH